MGRAKNGNQDSHFQKHVHRRFIPLLKVFRTISFGESQIAVRKYLNVTFAYLDTFCLVPHGKQPCDLIVSTDKLQAFAR